MDQFALLRALIGKGYFPAELPPPFVTDSYASQCVSLLEAWGDGVAKYPSQPEHYSKARHGHRRRHLRIPNPVSHLAVANLIAQNWRVIKSHFGEPVFALTNPEICLADKPNERAVRLPPIDEHPKKRVLAAAPYRYILKTDITEFYPSIYTHTIPWALDGKDQAKQRRIKKGTAWSDDLDKALRNCNNGQTVGIPIGPDTSYIVAEILMSAIDRTVKSALRGRVKSGVRHIDDFFLCFDSYLDAEAGLATIGKAVAHFDLKINVGKTRIEENIQHIEPAWPHTIATLAAAPKTTKKEPDNLMHYFSVAFSLAEKHGDESIMNHAIWKYKLPDASGCWDLYRGFLIRSALAYPETVHAVALQLVNYALRGERNGQKNKDILSEMVSSLIIRHALLDHHSEVTWALWLAKTLNLTVPAAAAKLLSEMKSGVCALLALDCRENGIIKGELDTSFWLRQISEGGLKGENWLLIYEAGRREWLSGESVNLVRDDPFFGKLKDASVGFYDENPQPDADELDPLASVSGY